MKTGGLKKIRVIVSPAILVLFFFVFFRTTERNLFFQETLTYLQFVPSIVKFFAAGVMAAVFGFGGIALLTFVFGRFYCSSLCPLGTVQDIFIYLRYKFRKKKWFAPKKNRRAVRYGSAALVFGGLAAGNMFFLNILEPYSNFGRIVSEAVKPAYIALNNTISAVLAGFDIYAVSPVAGHNSPVSIVVCASGFLVVIAALSFFRGRFFCNTLCPAGAILGIISKKPVYGIKLCGDECSGCGLCGRVCKAECIDCSEKKVDHEKCVLCFNCVSACVKGAIKYTRLHKKPEKEPVDTKRRKVLKMISAAAVSVFSFVWARGVFAKSVPIVKKLPVIPPGSKSLEHFNSTCTGCHLCVSVCPTDVITPTFIKHGPGGVFQPELDYKNSYCLYECALCSEVCPSGAIKKLEAREKKRIKIGEVKLIKENCEGWEKHVNCNLCDEYCPTKAVHAELHPDIPGLYVPYITQDRCIGCGACENVCPAEPIKAIYVDGIKEHGEAKAPGREQGRRKEEGARPKTKKPGVSPADEFPF